MSMSILNNIPSLVAQNQLAATNTSLQNTLFQLSSGSKINTGADDPAGLAIANGLQANIAALNQSAQNASEGVGNLQVADGALSQVTSLLNRAVTLATEASNGGLSSSQLNALNNEYASIVNEINQIGTNTTYNGTAVFTGGNLSIFLSDGSSTDAGSTSGPTISVGMPTLSSPNIGLGDFATGTLTYAGSTDFATGATVTLGGTTYTFVTALDTTTADEVLIGANQQATLLNLEAAVNGGAGSGTAYSTGTVANTSAQVTSVYQNSSGDYALSVQSLKAGTGANSIAVGASTSAAATWGGTSVTTLTGGAGAAVDLSSASDAQSALTQIESAIASVASTRGSIGAAINRLNAAVNVMNNQVQNLTSAVSGIQDANVGQVVANMSKYQVLEQTGIAALAQANSQEQSVLKLLQ